MRRWKTPRSLGYSQRHASRILKRKLEDDWNELMETDTEDSRFDPNASTSGEIIQKGEDEAIHEGVSNESDVQESSEENSNEECAQTKDVQDDNNSLNQILDVSDESSLPESLDQFGREKQSDENELLEFDLSSDVSIFDDDYVDYYLEDSDSDYTFSSNSEADELPQTNVHVEDVEEEKNQQRSLLKNTLQQWALKFHISLVALTALLLIFKPFLPFPFPADARTLMGTVRHVKISELGGGEYHYFGLERAVKTILLNYNKLNKEVKELKLTINIDGVPTSHSGTEGLWLILCSEENTQNVYLIAAYYGKKKPTDANEFIEQVVKELIDLSNNGLNNSKITISCSALICDAPAKSFILYLKGHTGYNSCTKCRIEGEYDSQKHKRKGKKRGSICFPGIGPFRMKTDKGFNNNAYEEYDTGKETIMKTVPKFGCVSSVPLDYMHLILLGVVKKLIRLWLMGPLSVRLSAICVTKISKILILLRNSVPMEFNRKPRTLEEFTHWKATEFRTFLLYTGPIALKNILKTEVYQHFLLLHAAVSILVNESCVQTSENIAKCQEMLNRFVLDFERIYGKRFISHNVHNLLHICSDVRKYGALDKFSAFKFENKMSSIKKMIRKGHKPLEQIVRRYSEFENFENFQIEEAYVLKNPHKSGPISKDCTSNIREQYKIFKNKAFTINCTALKDSCILPQDNTFCSIKNIIVTYTNDILFVVKRIVKTRQLNNNGDSQDVNIYIGTDSNEVEFTTPITNLKEKVWRIPTNDGIILIPLRHPC